MKSIFLIPSFIRQWKLGSAKGAKEMQVKRVSIWEVLVILLHGGAVQSRAEPATSACPSIYSVFLQFPSAESGTHGNASSSKTLQLLEPNWQSCSTRLDRAHLAPRKRETRKPVLASRAQLLLKLGNCLFELWRGFWVFTLITREVGSRIWTLQISIQLLITYRLMFLCFLGRVYLRLIDRLSP